MQLPSGATKWNGSPHLSSFCFSSAACSPNGQEQVGAPKEKTERNRRLISSDGKKAIHSNVKPCLTCRTPFTTACTSQPQVTSSTEAPTNGRAIKLKA